MKKIAIIQARMGSTRFSGKVLEMLQDRPILQWVTEAVASIPTIDEVVVATSNLKVDQQITNWCNSNNILNFAGSESDVLGRFFETAKFFKADIVVRITADCPLLDPYIAGQVLFLVAQSYADYASNIMPPTFPDGLDCEAFTIEALEKAYLNATYPSDREHVTPYIRRNQKCFKSLNVTSPIPGLQKHRWTIDTKEDLEFIKELLSHSKKNPTTYDLLETLKSNPQITQPLFRRNEGFEKSIQAEKKFCTDFKNSHASLNRALKTIPLGSQTFSKSYIQYPQNTAPMFLTHGQGAKVWDVDGNEYIDLVSGLLCNILGYNDPDVNFAVQSQLQKGISFSLATELETQLAEKLCEIIPSAEKVRFGKNGTDATSAAVRLARAYTGRDKIIVCGYHGWQDWYIGTTSRNKGIPRSVCSLSISIPYNDLNRIEELLKEETIAAIIMEPCNSQSPIAGYLHGVKDLCEKYNSLLIFDEIITGFRFSLGGAQKYFGVTPHLSCFGKAMGNGMPISAIVGRKDIMDEMESIFFSGTFGGETLSLATAIATIKKIEQENVINHLWTFGETVNNEVTALIEVYELQNYIKLCGYSPWKLIQFLDYDKFNAFEIKTYFMQEMIKLGILVAGSHNITYAHQNMELAQIVKAYESVFTMLKVRLADGTLLSSLKSPIIQPLFKVR
jgi:glutamate-1-semialdehyde aminotransferase/spore coat polysaccharide biosynthesis protein SpsF (cytidylyltransferase family)